LGEGEVAVTLFFSPLSSFHFPFTMIDVLQKEAAITSLSVNLGHTTPHFTHRASICQQHGSFSIFGGREEALLRLGWGREDRSLDLLEIRDAKEARDWGLPDDEGAKASKHVGGEPKHEHPRGECHGHWDESNSPKARGTEDPRLQGKALTSSHL